MLVIGHRGASGDAPENTMKAFALAKTQGADGIELDVYRTSDGHIVVTHDETTKRFTGVDLKVRKSTLARLKELNFGEGERIPTLKEVLDAFGREFAMINIEIKSTGFLSDGVEEGVIECLRATNTQSKVLVSSFNPMHLVRMKARAPGIARGFLMADDNWYVPPQVFAPLVGASFLNCDFRLLTPELRAWASSKGVKICLWTVNREEDMSHCLKQPVEAVITNYPARLRQLIHDFEQDPNSPDR